MDVTGILNAAGQYGLPMVISGFVIYGAVRFVIWLRGHIDRKIAKDEERRDKQEARNERLAETTVRATEGIEVIAKQTEKQTEFMERMDLRLDDHGRRLDEHGSALTRILGHLFKEEGKRD